MPPGSKKPTPGSSQPSPKNKLPVVQLFTDGACHGNPGPGGWAFILKQPDSIMEISGGDPSTTNNRMELTAVIKGLAALPKPYCVELHSDSVYVLKGLKEWMANWKKRGWRKADKKPVLNVDLWKELDELIQIHQLEYKWVKGHSGHPENEQCDLMATNEAEKYRYT